MLKTTYQFVWPLFCIFLLGGCHEQQHRKQEKNSPVRQTDLAGFHTKFYRITEGKQSWIEIAIAVDNNKTFRMPVFFTNKGELVNIDDDDKARVLLEKWVKRRAQSIAAMGSLDPQIGNNEPFLAIDSNNP